jgi:NAD(P)-dependent dehydrogenase (short-subunit alcohol dehydrogenase family)
MTRIFITGSTEGLGRAAALALLDDGHEVFLHARNPSRAASMGDLADRGSGVVIGDLGSAEETHDVADQVNAIGRMDAVIHNAGIYIDSQRVATPRGTRAHAGCQRSSALRVDRRGRASRPTDLHQQRHASRRRRVLARHRLELATMARRTGVLGQQALRRHVRILCLAKARPTESLLRLWEKGRPSRRCATRISRFRS